MNTPITLSDKLSAEVRRIGAVLGLSDNACVGYLLKAYLDSFPDGDTYRLIDLAEMLEYVTQEEADGVARRLEAMAIENHLAATAGTPHEPIISVKILSTVDGKWQLSTDILAGDRWRGVMDMPERDWPGDNGEQWKAIE